MYEQKGVKIDGGWKGVVGALLVVFMFVVLPIGINESIGFDKIVASITAPEQEINPYYSSGQVAGIFTNEEIQSRAGKQFINIPLVNTSIEVNKQNLLIFTVASLSLIIFVVLYSLLSMYENRNKKEELLPINQISTSI